MALRSLSVLAFVACVDICGPGAVPIVLEPQAFQNTKPRYVSRFSAGEALDVLQVPAYPMMEEENMDPETLTPPPLVKIDSYVYDEFIRMDASMATLPGVEGQDIEIHSWMTWFRVRSDLGRCAMVINRHNHDLNDRAIGIFIKDWTDEDLAELQSRTEGVPWSELLEPEGGHISGAQITIKYARENIIVDREFNSYNRAFMATIWSLLDWMSQRLSGLANERPLAGLRISVEARPAPQKPGEYTLLVIFTNPGTHPVLFHDPRRPPRPNADDPQPRLVLRVTPKSDLPTPPFVRMKLEPAPEGPPGMITLPGGGRFEVTAPWSPPAPGAYGVIAEWIDYEPPLEGVEYAPIMPLPADLDEPFMELTAPYPLMGGAFTGRMIEIPAPGAQR